MNVGANLDPLTAAGLFIRDCFRILLQEKKTFFSTEKKRLFFSCCKPIHINIFTMGDPIRPSELKNKHKRENLYQKQRLEKQKAKSSKRKQLAKAEEKNPELKKVCILLLDIEINNKKDVILTTMDRNVWKKMYQRL